MAELVLSQLLVAWRPRYSLLIDVFRNYGLSPKELQHLEMDIRRWVGESVGRGQVTVRIEAFFESKAPLQPTANVPLAKQLGQVWKDWETR